MNTLINTLSGPDHVNVSTKQQDIVTNPLQIDTSLSGGKDVRTVSSGTSASPSVRGSGRHATDSGIRDTVVRWVASNGDPDYFFDYTMPDTVLNRYLDKTIMMTGLCAQYDKDRGEIGGTTNAEYVEDIAMLVDIGPKMVLGVADQGFAGAQGNGELNALFGKLKSTIDTYHQNYDPDVIFGAAMSENIDSWWTSYKQVAISPGVFDSVLDETPIPYYVFDDLGIDHILRNPADLNDKTYVSPEPGYTPGDTTKLCDISQTFKAIWMHRNDTTNLPPSYYPYTPDITLIETQLFYYYLATKYIDAGCEMLFLGDYWLVNKNDAYGIPSQQILPGNQATWNLFSAIRRYARTHARRHMIILGVHQSGRQPFYYDPPDPANPGQVIIYPNWQRQMLFDFYMWRAPYTRQEPLSRCTDEYQPLLLLTTNSPMESNPVPPNVGGKNPQGEIVAHTPFLINFDRGVGPDVSDAGCTFADPAYIHQPYQVIPNTGPIYGHHEQCPPDKEICGYGWDSITWFALQGDKNDPTQKIWYRNNILKYFYYKIKCYSPYGHLIMPGRVPVNLTFDRATTNAPTTIYRANNSTSLPQFPVYMQQQTIKDLWNGVYNEPLDWAHHNFTTENVASYFIFNGDEKTGRVAAPVSSSLIFVGTDKIFYIGADGFIYGYIYIDGIYNGGTWLGVSPSYAADIFHNQHVASQVKAKCDLVANPDGSMLLYIGIDGYVHGFYIEDIWRYYYFDFNKNDMIYQGIHAVSDLIFPTNDSIYYIGRESSGAQHIHGFQRSSGPWLTVSPSYSADGTHIPSMSIAQQLEAAGALTYEREYNRLYYRTTNGYLAYFDIKPNLIDYYYAPCPINSSLQSQGVTVVGKLAIHWGDIYFVGLFAGTYYIYCVRDNGATWGSVSPSWSADMYSHQPIASQVQSDPMGEIAVSPDGNTIAYFGKAPQNYLCYYKNLGGVNYSFQGTKFCGVTPGANSLQFISNDDLYYISPDVLRHGDGMVHHFTYQQAYCNNNSIAVIEGA